MSLSRLQFLVYWISLASFFQANAQRDQGGFISPGDSLRNLLPKERIIFLPRDGFTFYEVPNGAFKGKILPGPPLALRNPAEELDTLLNSTITGASISPQLLTISSYFETSDNRFYLTFDQQQDSCVHVLGDSYRGWIPLEEILKKGFVLVSWMEFYGETKGRLIHPLEKIAPILTGPYPDAKVIEVADELYCEITSTGKCEGPYCKVNVVQYKNPYDHAKSREENLLKKYKGWLRIIDDNGRPLVGHHSNDF